MSEYNNLENQVLDAIEMIVSSAIDSARYDKTIIGTVVKCTDAATGRYKVKYQDASYVATADSLDKRYKEGASVYILVPEGDFSKPKKIIGETSSSTETSSSSQLDNPISNLIEVGDNIIIAPEDFSTNKFSYGEEANEYLTIFNSNSNNNKVTVDNENLNKNILEGKCRYFRFSANFKTELSLPQQFKGEYGLLLTLKYKDENEVEQIQDYKLDSSGMYGNPYKFTNWVNQSSIFNLPLGTDIEIIKIGLYSYNFSDNYTANKSNLIYVSNLKLIPMGESTSTYFSTYAMEISGGDKGLTFNSDVSSLKLKPVVTYQNRPVDISNSEIYWFKEDSQVTSSHSSYAQQGGKGWACLNNISTLEMNGSQISKFNSQLELELQKPVSYAAAEVRYKCVVILSNATIEKEFLITNSDYNQKLILTSSNGNSFTNQTSATTLTAIFLYRSESSQRLDESKLQYNWHIISQTGEVENIYYHAKKDNKDSITNTIEKNESLKLDILNGSSNKSIYERIKKLEQVIDEGSSKNPPTFSKDTLFGQHYLGAGKSDDYIKEISNFESQNSGVDKFILSQMGITLTELTTLNYNRFKELLKKVDDLNFITFLHEDVFYELPARLNTGTTTYVCSCNLIDGDNSIYLGSARVQIANDYKTQETATGWSVNIVNGTQFFKYDATGEAPTKKTQRNPQPQLVKSLSFNVFDEKGKQIEDAKIVEENPKKDTIISSWYWEIPAEDTLLSFDKGLIGEQTAENGMYKIHNVKLLPFGIADSFNNDTGNNIIYLTVNYKDGSVKTQTNFSFIKDGNNGTNATDFYCKISPNLEDNVQLEEYPAIIYRPNGGGDGVLNFTPKGASNEWFKAELFLNGEPSNTSINSITWNILTHKELGGKNTESHYIYKSDTKWSAKKLSNIEGDKIPNPSNITQACIRYTKPKPANTSATGNTQTIINQNSPTQIYGTITLDTIIEKTNYKIRINPRSGFNEVVYSEAGTNPQYPKNKYFEVEVFDSEDSQYSDNLAKQTASTEKGTPFTIKFEIYGPKEFLKIDEPLKDDQKNICRITAKESYGGYETNCGLKVTIFKADGNLIGQIYHPIHLMINRYGKAALNGWDGNGVQMGDKIILSPQVGAGIKHEDNTFTGMLIGSVKDTQTMGEEQGLFGYRKNVRTIFLDANTGKAEFGPANSKIIISPTQGENKIWGGGYYEGDDGKTEAGKGLLIDLSTPEIKWGNGNFEVNLDGILKARGADVQGAINVNGNNLYNTGYDTFETFTSIKDGDKNIYYGEHLEEGSSISLADNAYHGNKCLKIVNNNSGELYFILGINDEEKGFGYIPISSLSDDETYIISAYVKTNTAGTGVTLWAVEHSDRSNAGASAGMTAGSYSIQKANTWERFSFKFIPKENSNYLKLRFDVDTSGRTVWLDAIQIEKAYKEQQPGSFSPAGSTLIDGGMIMTNSIHADKIQTNTIEAVGSVTAGQFYLGAKQADGTYLFQVDETGKLSATSAVIKGTLTAGSGSKIGPWYISDDSISKNSGGTAASSHGTPGAGNMYFGNSGLSISNVFKVSNTGHLEASSVNIGNGKLTFDTNGLTVSGTITGSKINGSEITGANNKFSVKNDGTVSIEGLLKAGADSEIGPWKVGATSISLISDGDEGSNASISMGKNGIAYKVNNINVFKVGSTGHVTLVDGSDPEGDNSNPADGNSLLIVKNKASGTDKITYLKPNRITFIDKTAGTDYTGGSLLYYGGTATSAENAEEGDINDVNYFYFTRPFALPLSRSIKGDTSQTGWKNTWYSIKGMGGVPVLSQAYWKQYAIMTGYEYGGYALVFGPSSKHAGNSLATSSGSSSYKQTVIRGGNVHMVAHAGGSSNGDIILKGEEKIVIAAKDFNNIVFRDRTNNGREVTLKSILDKLSS